MHRTDVDHARDKILYFWCLWAWTCMAWYSRFDYVMRKYQNKGYSLPWTNEIRSFGTYFERVDNLGVLFCRSRKSLFLFTNAVFGEVGITACIEEKLHQIKMYSCWYGLGCFSLPESDLKSLDLSLDFWYQLV